ncbi:MAG TPA: hypothetical protein P5341_13725 [Hyphomonas sp.]|nr:hypothetical protein [Hyphomonas sp.]
MKKAGRSSFAWIVLAASLAACATPATGGPEQVASLTGPDGEPVICREVKVTGTRFPQKTCKTAEAWEQFDAYTNGSAKEQTDKFQRLNTGCSTQGNCH